MHRLFGKSKPATEKVPEPTLTDASNSINARVTALDVKIKSLEDELRKFKDQMKKATGATKEAIHRRAMETLKRKKMYEQQRDQMAGQAFNIEQTSFAIDTSKPSFTEVVVNDNDNYNYNCFFILFYIQIRIFYYSIPFNYISYPF